MGKWDDTKIIEYLRSVQVVSETACRMNISIVLPGYDQLAAASGWSSSTIKKRLHAMQDEGRVKAGWYNHHPRRRRLWKVVDVLGAEKTSPERREEWIAEILRGSHSVGGAAYAVFYRYHDHTKFSANHVHLSKWYGIATEVYWRIQEQIHVHQSIDCIRYPRTGSPTQGDDNDTK